MSYKQVAEYIKIRNRLKKVIILGDGSVGKTSLVNILTNNINLSQTSKTPYVNITTFQTTNHKFTLLDTAGQIQQLPIHITSLNPELIFSNTDLIILMFSNTHVQSLIDIEMWYDIVKHYFVEKNLNVPKLLLIKSKIDLISNIDTGLVNTIINKLQCEYIEISNFTKVGFDKLESFLSTV